MIKDDLARTIAEEYELSRSLSTRIVQTVLDKIIDGLVKESRIELRRFGVFAVKQQGSRVITLPSGKKITRPAQKVVTFAPGAAVKKKLNPKTSKKK